MLHYILLFTFSNDILLPFLGLLVILGLFLIFRALWLWYWKIDVIVGELKIIVAEMKKIRNSLESKSDN